MDCSTTISADISSVEVVQWINNPRPSIGDAVRLGVGLRYYTGQSVAFTQDYFPAFAIFLVQKSELDEFKRLDTREDYYWDLWLVQEVAKLQEKRAASDSLASLKRMLGESHEPARSFDSEGKIRREPARFTEREQKRYERAWMKHIKEFSYIDTDERTRYFRWLEKLQERLLFVCPACGIVVPWGDHHICKFPARPVRTNRYIPDDYDEEDWFVELFWDDAVKHAEESCCSF